MKNLAPRPSVSRLGRVTSWGSSLRSGCPTREEGEGDFSDGGGARIGAAGDRAVADKTLKAVAARFLATNSRSARAFPRPPTA